MYEDVKICPECGAEYFAHVEECKDCGVRLLHPEEKARLDEKASEPVCSVAGESDGSTVCIEQGLLAHLKELQGALEAEGIECEIVKSQETTPSCTKGETFSLLVPKDASGEALKAIEEYWHRLHPEVKQAEQMISEGLCPCCGSDVKGMPVCPECGLALEGPSGEEGV